MNQKLRSVLYVPGINTKAMSKIASLAADAVIIDLEDSIAPGRKQEAREVAAQFLHDNRASLKNVYVVLRVNGQDTEFWEDDLGIVGTAQPDAVLLPKVSDANIIKDARTIMAKAGSDVPPIWCMVENPRGILKLEQIIESLEPGIIECLVLGTNDLVKDSNIILDKDRSNLLPWFAHVMLVAKTFDIPVIDGVVNDFRDLEQLKAECQLARSLGMSGKTVIHPAQIEETNLGFTPSKEQLQQWQRIVDAYALPENQQAGVIAVDGTMVERLHLEIAQRELAKYEDMAG